MARLRATLFVVFALTAGAVQIHAAETVVFLRHGEKPALGLGQLSCQGLNRALALPAVLQAKFGTANAIYAPDPGTKAKDKGIEYNYVRPLATIEPTAIRLGLPVNTTFGLAQIKPLEQDLLRPANRASIIYVAWEHNLAQQAAQQLINSTGGHAQVPRWADDDYDSLYVLRVKWQNDKPVAVNFKIEAEGLNNQPSECVEPRA